MKSLDFLEKLEKDYHNNIIGLYYRTSISKEYRDKLYDKYNKDFEKIKQDLEVLEILKDLFKKNSREYIGNDFGVMINGVELYMKNREEFKKLKQWLEENEE